MCLIIKIKLLKIFFENDMKFFKKFYAKFFWNSMLKFNVNCVVDLHVIRENISHNVIIHFVKQIVYYSNWFRF